MTHVVHWDDLERDRSERGPLRGWWTDLGSAVGTLGVGVSRIQLDEGDRATPAHVQGAEEEIFYILGGQGVSWQDGETFDVRAGDTLVHLPCREAHTLIGGPGGIDALAFGQRIRTEACHLPRAGVFWLGPAWTDDAVAAGHPWEREVAAGDIPMPERSPRPPRIVAAEDVPVMEFPGARGWDLGRAAGSVATGIKLAELDEDAEGAPPHCHGAEEEIFVVLAGKGVLTLGDEEHEVRPGTVVGRPPGTRVPHAFRGGEGGLTYLAYGTREPNDIVYYPRSGKVSLKGVGIVFKPEQVAFWEPGD